MRTRWLFFGALAIVLLAVAFGYFHFSNRFSVLLNAHATIELNGAPVRGEMLEGRTTAIVTTREAGKNHSYQLFFEGDTDSTGDMGSVADCGSWVAPHLPFLVETRNYPPCENFRVFHAGRWPLIDKGKSMLFVLQDQSTITINR